VARWKMALAAGLVAGSLVIAPAAQADLSAAPPADSESAAPAAESLGASNYTVTLVCPQGSIYQQSGRYCTPEWDAAGSNTQASYRIVVSNMENQKIWVCLRVRMYVNKTWKGEQVFADQPYAVPANTQDVIFPSKTSFYSQLAKPAIAFKSSNTMTLRKYNVISGPSCHS
jgi:hypothetical protein